MSTRLDRAARELRGETGRELKWSYAFYEALLTTLFQRMINAREPAEKLHSAELVLAALRGLGAWDEQRTGYRKAGELVLAIASGIAAEKISGYVDNRRLARTSLEQAIDLAVERILEDSLKALVEKGVIPTMSQLTTMTAI